MALLGRAVLASLFGVAIAGPIGFGSTGAAAANSSSKPSLVLYSAEGYDAAVLAAFRKASGIKVKLDTRPAAVLLSQIEASKKHPKWDVFWVDGPTNFAPLDEQHLLVRDLKPDVSWNSLGKMALPKDTSYVPTGVTLSNALLYTVKAVPDPPTNWQELLEGKWKGEVGMPDPNEAATAYPFIAGMLNQMGGDENVTRGETYFKELKANKVVVSTSNTQTVDSLIDGNIKLALVQSCAAVGAANTHPTLRVSYLPQVTVLPSAIGIDARVSSAEKSEAEQFVNFVLSPAGQKAMRSATPTDDSWFYPVVKGVTPPTSLPALSSIKTQVITPYVWGGQRESDVKAWFETHVAK